MIPRNMFVFIGFSFLKLWEPEFHFVPVSFPLKENPYSKAALLLIACRLYTEYYNGTIKIIDAERLSIVYS